MHNIDGLFQYLIAVALIGSFAIVCAVWLVVWLLRGKRK